MTELIRYKDADVDESFENDWSSVIINQWRPDYKWPAGSIVRPPVGNGFVYVNETGEARRCGLLVPDFVPGVGETTQDGSVIWTAREEDDVGIEAISASVFTLDAGISEVASAIDGLLTTITISGGVAGEQYRVRNVITLSTGGQEPYSWILEINNPQAV